ncbi:hypothetical protein OUZ56_012928 [Daphnia magna]|uniref:Uncharacterized protein n=1 Tax=Daphnia magna TaxID=35525 RepID=A0ABQ9Z4F7_9CRUS|nr:hypothetical protein OUZ56_012928 [Daphnia magna]
MDPIELLRGLRSQKIVLDLNSFNVPHVSHYAEITTKQLSIIIRPYPSGGTMPTDRRYLWLPSATLLQQVMDITYPNRTKTKEPSSTELNQPGKAELPPFVEEALVKPAKQIVTKLTTTPKPADTQTDFIEYTSSFKPPKRIIPRLAPEGLN